MSIFSSSITNSICRHSEFPPTLFCNYKSCNRSLCPTCISKHTHPTNKTYLIPIEEALKISKINAEKYIESLAYEFEKTNIHLNDLEIEKSNNEDIKLILRSKQNIKKIVKKFFQTLEESYKKLNYECFDEKIQKINIIQRKILEWKEKFQKIHEGLNSEELSKLNISSLIETTLNIDMKNELLNLSNQFKDIVEKKHNQKFQKLPETTLNLEFILKNIFHESLKILIEETPLHTNNINEQIIDTSTITSTFLITQPNYFEKNTIHKCLHFFNSDDNTFNFLDFDSIMSELAQTKALSKSKFERVKIVNPTDLPIRHRSIILPDGSIYFMGGHHKSTNITSNEMFRWNWETKSLTNRADMITARKSFGVCYNNNFIYVIGGFNYDEGYLNKCEKFDVNKDKWITIASLSGAPSSSPCVCLYKGIYLFKFGGLKAPNTSVENLERYDIEADKWLNFDIMDQKINDSALKFLWLSAAIQINDNELMVFGGLDNENRSSDQTFIVKIINDTMFRVINVGTRKLVEGGGFWNNQTIIHNQKLFALQNINIEKTPEKAIENKRNIIFFSDFKWN